MNRRAFLSLAGAAGTVPLWPLPAGQEPQGAPNPPPWRFDVDGRLRWRLSRGGVVAAAAASVSLVLDGRRVSLAELDEVRRHRGGTRERGVWVVAGRTANTEVTAEFIDDIERPAITVRVRGLGERRVLDTVTFLATADGALVPALRAAGSRAWINGFQSWSACRVVESAMAEATGHWQVALVTGVRGQGSGAAGGWPGLGMMFGENDTGLGEFVLQRGALTAVSRCAGRPVGYDLAPATCKLTLLPSADVFEALGRAALFASGRPLRESTPSGWCSWYELFGAVTEADVLASLEVARRRFDRNAFRVVQLDDGFQKACGDWEMNAKFPSGHRWLTEQIRQAGFEPGLWIAPFAVADRSGIPVVHTDWLLQDAAGAPLVLDARDDWGGRIFGLDAEVDDAREHLRLLVRHAVQFWGYSYLKFDFLYYAAQGPRVGRRWSPAETYRAGMRALAAGAGNAFVLGCGAPLQHAVGLVDGMRIGSDIEASFGGIQVGVRAALQRAHLHRRAWLNDPDALVVREPLTLDEAWMWATATALSGGMTLASDRLERLSDERLDLIQRTMPALPVRGEALGLAPARGTTRDEPPSWMLAATGEGGGRWMLAVFNWTEDERRITASFAGRLAGTFASYDVWRDARGPDITGGAVRLVVPPHTVTCLALRRPRAAAPFVLGSNRHVIQGLHDAAGERWDPRRRALSGSARGLDRRPHAITIAIPAGWHPTACSGSVPCTVRHPHGPGRVGARTVKVSFEVADELEWEVRF